ncbi:hypothetical protein SERLA73DRAFT_68688 [Serpula lacrymans var. lacrymans S7.3]|uniref:Reverse transcriptase Ty1/copia-type domain-containing protein n=2 Tax=Serpula lacrymans var. lacrymans TaxID=341189 RepID=F8PHP4_SERL3|nr:uncharacterized protein SERLADRAFT_432452 [Serpula lacrymans var. lacrymans S7.9]EGO05041.1 hypothetical protein SERLA73DRAFT_68688 [Serpula lacrymans var. lacrymans S7.3]EGO30814.1 hypothetical protein SERLADRAFT_432452 [Serpula lacrymans var. lacrymans S7.9]
MLIQAKLPRNLWAEAINYAVWLKNRTSTKALPKKTPYKMPNSSKPNLSKIHKFGCPVLVKRKHSPKLKSVKQEICFKPENENTPGNSMFEGGNTKQEKPDKKDDLPAKPPISASTETIQPINVRQGPPTE